MGAPRRHGIIQIYQDPDDLSPTFQQPPQKPRPRLQPSAIPRQPGLNPRNPHNVALNAPAFAHNHAISPQKTHQFQPPMMSYDNMGFVELPAPQSTHAFDESPSKRMVPAAPQHQFGQSYAAQNVMAFEPHFESFDQENIHAVAANDNADFPSPSYSRRSNLKRSNSDSAPLNDRGIKRQRVEEDTKIQIPEPENMPAVEDDGTKPPYSYAQMIGMAILRAKGRKLTLAQIYDWISRTFAFYREDPKQGWHNSIRHNLSLNKAFGKTERPKGDPGKGCYWVILEGMEGQFLKDKGRKASNNNNNLSGMTVHANVMRPEPMTLSQPAPTLEPLGPSPFIQETFTIEPRPQTAPALPDLSSDATVPASDPALNEDQEQGVSEVAIPALPQSSPPDGINSSPPVTSNVHRRSGSSPSARRQQLAVTGHKRSATTMNDSGYWSSIESSAMRPRQQQMALTSDLDIEPTQKKRKTGRAEDEIARIQRIRGPSLEHSSPLLRTTGANALLGSAASSPPRPIAQLLPTTPGVFKKPARPIPDSVSPNTQLANHRQQMSSLFESPTPELLPNLAADPLSATTSPLKFSATPGFVLNDSPFQIYDESALQFTPVMALNFSHSPIKSAKRPPLVRAATGTSNKLHELLHSANVNRGKWAKDDNTPSKPGPWIRSNSAFAFSGSPVKNDAVLCQDENEFPNFEDFVEDGFVEDGDVNEDDDIAVDIASGFPTIGVVNPTALSKRRPGLGGRSHTSWM